MERTIVLAPVRKTIRVTASPARAFEVFTAGMSRWWPPTHTTLKAPLREIVIEPRAGGRWRQIGADGSICETGRVEVWEPPARLVLIWQLNPKWEFDPKLITEVEVRFAADGAATVVELEHRHIERMGEGAEATREAVDAAGGWTAILEEFRKSIEGSR